MSALNQYQDLKLSELEVNSANARHDELSNEIEAINWLVDNLPERMKKLAQDILDKGFVYDPPLVKQEDGKYKIYDGNRRVSCVKILQNPSIVNDGKLKSFFEKLSQSSLEKIPSVIHCRIESDMQVVNDIIERRHAGGDSGIGQMSWGAEEKDNFFRRSGSPYYKPKFGTELSHFLKEHGILKSEQKINISIFDRLLSNEHYRNMVGLSFKGRELAFVYDKDESLNALKKIVQDSQTGDINLNKAWDNSQKDAYFLQLRQDGYLPNGEGKKLNESENDKPVENPSKKPKKKKPALRPTLIPQSLELKNSQGPARMNNVFIELQYDLFFSKHVNAISVMFRVLLELCVDNYVNTRGLTVPTKNKYGASLAEKFTVCVEELHKLGDITKQERALLIKFKQPEQFLSADTFNAYVHHPKANPTQADLIAKWDNLEDFVMRCVHVEELDKKPEAA